MHRFLRSIGFREYRTRKQEQDLLRTVQEQPDASWVFYDADKECRAAYYAKELAEGLGIMLYGEFDEESDGRETFQPILYYPYVESDEVSGKNPCDICRHSSQEDFIANCDDYHFGVTLIFHVINQAQLKMALSKYKRLRGETGYRLSGLAENGKILMPILKTKTQIEEAKEEAKKRSYLIEKAKNGNEEAIETLTMSEMNTYTKMNHLVQHNDIYSLIDSFFMPNGMECDMYAIMGDILTLGRVTNPITQETMYVMTLDCNDVTMKITINEQDLLGVPEVGRRFKGLVWMQGYLELG
ncbi:MAG: DUF3881 family protein [Lachnospiraceae bacterium]